MNLPLVLPLLIPLSVAALLLILRNRLQWQRTIGIAGATAMLAASLWLLAIVRSEGIQVTQVGNWPAPFGISLVADLFSAIMVVLTGLMGFAVAVYSWHMVDDERQVGGYFPLLHILLMGVCGAFLTGDMFNLYVWFEVMLIASFVLLALGGERGQLEGSIKYVTINLISSAVFLAGLGILYAATGTLNMADLSGKLGAFDNPAVSTVLAVLFLIAFGVKAAIFPLFFWLPASYHTPPAAVSAIFAGLLTKVGVYALVRVFTLLFIYEVHVTHYLLLFIAGFTMVTGVLGAIAQQEVRRLLSFHIISQIGYMIMGLAIYTPLALAGVVVFIAHNIVVKANLFLISGLIERLQGTGKLKWLGGLYASRPGLSILFLISALSLAGVPPLSGFFGKLFLARAGLENGNYWIVGVSLAVSILTLFSMTKIWNEAFWKPQPEADGTEAEDEVAVQSTRLPESAVWPVVLLAVVTVAMGVFVGPFFMLASAAAEQLLRPDEYIHAVLGESR